MVDTRWFAAVLLFQSQVGSGWDDEPILDHAVRLIQAADPEDAYQRALALGEAGQHSYANAEGQQVTWQFLGLAELEELLDGAPRHGSEVFSWRTWERGEGLVRTKADLAVFVLARDGDRRAGDLLNE